MRHSARLMWACLAVIIIGLFLGAKAFAGDGGAEQAPGEPPKGLAIQSDAAGQKLSGDIFIEDWNWEHVAGGSDYAVVLRVALRLRGGSNLNTYSYFTDLNCTDSLDAVYCSPDPPPNEPKCLLKPICIKELLSSGWKCPDQTKGCYDVLDVPTIQKALTAWVNSDPEFCTFLEKFGLKCGKIALKTFDQYSHILATDPNGVPSSIHLSNIGIAIK